MRRQCDIDREQCLDVLLTRLADLESVGHTDMDLGRNLPEPMRLLLAEAEPKPRVDELCVGRRHERVVAPPLLLEPPRGRRGVQIADVLRLRDRVSGRLDPDVLSPYFGVTWRPDQVPDKPAAAEGCRTARALPTPRRHELVPRRSRLLETLGQERLGLALARMPGGKQPASVVQVLVQEGRDLQPGHRHRFADGSKRRGSRAGRGPSPRWRSLRA